MRQHTTAICTNKSNTAVRDDRITTGNAKNRLFLWSLLTIQSEKTTSNVQNIKRTRRGWAGIIDGRYIGCRVLLTVFWSFFMPAFFHLFSVKPKPELQIWLQKVVCSTEILSSLFYRLVKLQNSAPFSLPCRSEITESLLGETSGITDWHSSILNLSIEKKLILLPGLCEFWLLEVECKNSVQLQTFV